MKQLTANLRKATFPPRQSGVKHEADSIGYKSFYAG